MCPRFDRNLVVADEDLIALAAMIHSDAHSIKVIANGVDTSYYQPYTGQRYANTLVYNGALTYQANFDAMDYFLRDIFPLIIEQIPGVKLQITGRTNGVEIDKLPLYSRVEFTGYLDDIRPTVAKSCACVIPLRVGGGTRLKVLEAMALGTPVISTTKGAEGLDLRSDDHLMIADTPQEFASQTVRILQNPQIGDRLSQNAAKWVKERYDWGSIGLYFRQVVEELVE
jgi:glycosyltransferase involved in cell wall biosynthesis